MMHPLKSLLITKTMVKLHFYFTILSKMMVSKRWNWQIYTSFRSKIYNFLKCFLPLIFGFQNLRALSVLKRLLWDPVGQRPGHRRFATDHIFNVKLSVKYISMQMSII